MKITQLEVHILRAPDTGRPHWVSHFIVPRANEMLVRMRTDEGIEGIGLATSYTPIEAAIDVLSQRHRRADRRCRSAGPGAALPEAVRADLAAPGPRKGLVARSAGAHLLGRGHRRLGHRRQSGRTAVVPSVRRLSQRSALLRDLRLLPRRQDPGRAARRDADAQGAGPHRFQGQGGRPRAGARTSSGWRSSARSSARTTT